MTVEVHTIETPSLGDHSHVITDGHMAVVIDPQRDVDRVLQCTTEDGLTITHVLETHVHNDYVSGGLDLCARTGAAYLVANGEAVTFDHVPVHDGDRITSGEIELEAVATPGHTPNHVSWVLHGPDGPQAVFTGGSLLYAAVGRPDLISPELTDTLSRAQHRSARRLAERLPDDTVVHPTHGFGSHCASVTEEVLREGTVGDERTRNPALLLDEDAFVEQLLAGLHPYPRYYAHMGPTNAKGAAPIDLSPPRPFDAAQIREAIAQGHWVVDLRQRRAFAHDHVRGTVNVELRDDLPTYLGWIIPWDVPFVLIGDRADDVTEAQRMLARIGLDHPAGANGNGIDDAGAGSDRVSWRVGSFTDLATALDGDTPLTVLDVRERWEWDASHHPRALHVPFHELDGRVDEVPAETEVWVYCATGNRATVAGSLLERAGRRVVLLDDFCLPGDQPW
ncbi:MAG: MBL fold metallo-hydrolase [Nitriliruptoraceae bacterium]